MINYFVYKNGMGNCWSGFTDAVFKATGNHHLCLGNWGGLEKSENSDSFRFDNLAFLDDPAHRFSSDYDYIRVIAAREHRDQFVVLTFEKTELRFWQVNGDVPPPHRDGKVWDCAMACLRDRREMRAEFGPAKGEAKAEVKPQYFRTLPVRLLARIPRISLYTSIDSLASYQYLIRGTCRPLWRATGPTAAEHHPGVLGAKQPRIRPCDRVGGEEAFGAFIRLYLNDLLARHLPDAVHARLSDHVTDLASARAVVMATMNPILVETAALAFVQDLGLTPDIGVGKGKDVIDVRARAADRDGLRDTAIAAAAWRRLVSLQQAGPGFQLSEGLQSRLLGCGTLDIQCKAAGGGAAKDVLYFGFKAPEQDVENLLLLPALDRLLAASPEDWPALSRFLAMQAQILLGKWPSGTTVMEA